MKKLKKVIDVLTATSSNQEIYKKIHLALARQFQREIIENVRNEKLKIMISHAYESTGFYKKRYANINVDMKNFSIDDLKKLPLLEKEDIKNNFFELVAKDYDLKRTMRNRTSGSTGKPVINLQDIKIHKDVFEVNYFREREAWGCEGLNNVLMVVPKHFRVSEGAYPNNYFNDVNLDKIWQIHPEEEEYDYHTIFNEVRPDILYGNPHLLCSMAREINQKKIELLNPKIIISSFEMLDMLSRGFLEDTFKCKVYDVYGLSEIGDVAWECPVEEGYHINEDYVIVEVVDKDGKPVIEQEGDIVVTSLYNFPMPIIRYRTGDRGIMEVAECSCGRKTAKLKKILGRNVDIITLKSGKKISPYELMDVMNKNNVGQFQFVISSADTLIVKYINEINEHTITYMKEQLGIRLNNELQIELKRVSELPTEKSGKFKVIKREDN